MLKAKDIVTEEVARQAKFGYEPSWEDFVIAGQVAGIREVVEWDNETCPHLVDEYGGQLKHECGICRQAKLKEWGIK